MTVKCLTQIEKDDIARLYATGTANTHFLAVGYMCSTRTIHRVLVEQGVAPVRRVRKAKPIILVEPPELTPFEYIKCFFKAIFYKTKVHDQANQ